MVLSFSSHAQNPTPRYSIHLTTMDGNSLKGLLMQVNDSAIKVYPGKRKDWKTNMPPVQFNYTQIQQIRLKRKNGTFKGFLIGMVSGSAASLFLLMPGGKCGPDASGIGSIALFTASTVTGTVWGGKGFRRANINGNFNVFSAFKIRYDAKNKK